jgi:predicted NAD/FAD-dependent oxidoreductase
MRRAFHPGEWRGAIRDGVNAFPKWLAGGLDVRREVFAESVRAREHGYEVTVAGEEAPLRAAEVVITLPAPQAVRLLDRDASSDVRGAAMLLDAVGTSCCLTVIADYGTDAPRPDVDLWIPEDAKAVHQVAHDSAKRAPEARTVLVIQALPAWSAAHWEEDRGVWTGALLAEAARYVGAWAERPRRIDVQRWRFARPDGASQLRAPMLLRSGGRGMMGFAGELFAPEGGVQGAWKSGRALARRIIEEGR